MIGEQLEAEPPHRIPVCPPEALEDLDEPALGLVGPYDPQPVGAKRIQAMEAVHRELCHHDAGGAQGPEGRPQPLEVAVGARSDSDDRRLSAHGRRQQCPS